MYSQDLSNYKTRTSNHVEYLKFLYSQDLSNYKTPAFYLGVGELFLYSQDLSNYKTQLAGSRYGIGFCILKI